MDMESSRSLHIPTWIYGPNVTRALELVAPKPVPCFVAAASLCVAVSSSQILLGSQNIFLEGKEGRKE
jgi:hypothetical protein